MSSPPQIQVANLDHLGLVAGMIDTIGIEEKINQLVGTQPGEKVSPGQAVKAMILNGLGLVSAPLYLFSKFFEGKATEHLIGEGIQPEHLNDDRLGRVLDKLYLTGLSQIFATIAIGAAQQFNVSLETAHLDALMVADSALYSEANLVEMGTLKWLSRVPLTVKQAHILVSQLTTEAFTQSAITGYRWSQHQSQYGGIQQRWLVVESQERQQSDLKRLEKNLDKAQTEATRQLRELSRQSFACVADALKAANKLSKKLKYHQLVALDTQEIPPKSTRKNSSSSYKVTARIELKSDVVEVERQQAGRFILATNVLDVNQLSPDEMIAKYKNQQSAERGFSFLKDPLFFTDSVFLKSPERIEALALIMGLCLLVYTLAQRQIRQTLKQAQMGIKNQLGRLTERPTLRWIFQCFQAVHLLQVDSVKQVSNLTDERLRTLSFFPATCQAYYLIH